MDSNDSVEFDGLSDHEKAISELCNAIRLAVEYTWTKMFPPVDGWSWYDVLKKYDPETAAKFKLGYDEDSNLIKHARHELALIGEDPAVVNGYLKMIQIFADMGHSGGSASVFIPTLNALLQFKNLKPLTDDPNEWQQLTPEVWPYPKATWQNRRNGEAFSNDGGKTYYLLRDNFDSSGNKIIHKSEPK